MLSRACKVDKAFERNIRRLKPHEQGNGGEIFIGIPSMEVNLLYSPPVEGAPFKSIRHLHLMLLLFRHFDQFSNQFQTQNLVFLLNLSENMSQKKYCLPII